MATDILRILRSRHLLSESTFTSSSSSSVSKFLNGLRGRGGKNVSAYLGVDPTGGGLHVGHLASLRALKAIQRYGQVRPILLVGGATACVGDPSGKRAERPMLSVSDIETNAEGIRRDLGLLNFEGKDDSSKPIIVNNADWWNDMSALEFLRDVGRHFRANVMLQKESVRQRLNSGEGISFTEFSYQVLQGYDFLHLYQNHDCVLQVGGSDQWGNMTAGVNLVRRVEDEQVHGITVPLLTTSQGEKFGKTAGYVSLTTIPFLSPSISLILTYSMILTHTHTQTATQYGYAPRKLQTTISINTFSEPKMRM
jgi:tyrosyl-tRNA synthetase